VILVSSITLVGLKEATECLFNFSDDLSFFPEEAAHGVLGFWFRGLKFMQIELANFVR
jgi:hypothetical protein